jgi:RNA polymerase sigma factor (sigma-70 family)
MATASLARVVPRLRAAVLAPTGASGDAELLEQFIADRDERAFELLVRRHGPMVLAVCRRVLNHTQDAEDAFQATFLVLAHKAAAVSPRGRLAGWLHGVAHRTALKARHRAARRAAVEKRVPPRAPDEMSTDTDRAEWEPLLDGELAALPDHYRVPIVLCDLEGRTRAEVARTLGCTEGTLSSRLTRGRRLLARRLTRRGVRPTAAALAALAAPPAALAEPLIRTTVPAVLSVGARAATGPTGAVSPGVAELATGVMKSMFLQKLRAVALAALALAVATALAGSAYRGAAAPLAYAAPAPVPAADDKKAGIDALADAEGRLLMNRKVLRDMKCDIDQLDRIMDALEEAEKKAQQATAAAMGQLRFNAGGPGGNFDPEAFQKMVREAQASGEKEFRKATAAVVADLLTPAQRKRFREIDLQARGFEAFTTASVIKALGITDKQKDKFEANAKQVQDDVQAAIQRPAAGNLVVQALPPGGGVVVQGASAVDFDKLTRDARAEGTKRAVEILTDEQQAAWKKMTGEPFPHPLPIRTGGVGRTVGFGVGGVVRPLPAMPLLPAPPVPVAPALPAPPVPVQVVPAVPLRPAVPAAPAAPPAPPAQPVKE